MTAWLCPAGFIFEALPALFDSHHDVHLHPLLEGFDSKEAGMACRDFVVTNRVASCDGIRLDTEEDPKQVERGHEESEEFLQRLQLQPGHHGGPESGEKGVNLPCLFAFVLKRGLLISTKAFSSAQKEPVSHSAIKYQINTESTWSLFTSFHVISLPIPCIQFHFMRPYFSSFHLVSLHFKFVSFHFTLF